MSWKINSSTQMFIYTFYTNIWDQTPNPPTDQTITGFEAVYLAFTQKATISLGKVLVKIMIMIMVMLTTH